MVRQLESLFSGTSPSYFQEILKTEKKAWKGQSCWDTGRDTQHLIDLSES